VEPSKYFIDGVRKARGYSCKSREEVELAYKLLNENGVEKMIFKPTFGQGGLGVTMVTCTEDLEGLPIEELLLNVLGEDGSKGEEYGYKEGSRLFLVEEFIKVAAGLPSPAVICLGDYINILDQVLSPDDPFVHRGNQCPTALQPLVRDRCIHSMRSLHGAWSHLRGFWGVDFVIEAGTLDPILVDLNMCRPNGSHGPSILESCLPGNPQRVWKAVKILCLDRPAAFVFQALKDADLIYGHQEDPSVDEGMLMLSYVRDFKGRAFFCASSLERVQELIARYEALYYAIQPEGYHNHNVPAEEVEEIEEITADQ